MSTSEDSDVFTFVFNLENFSMAHQKVGEVIESPNILAEDLDDTKWILKVYPRGNKAWSEKYVSVFLGRAQEDDGPEEITIKYSFDLIASDSTLQENKNVEKKAITRNLSWGFPKFISREALFKVKSMLLPKDTLRIRCQIERVWPVNPIKQDIFLRTQMECEKVMFYWVVKDFSKCRNTEPMLVRFPSSNLAVYVLTMRVEEDGMVKVEIRLNNKIATPVVTFCRLRVLNEDRLPSFSLDKTDHHVFNNIDDVWHFASFLNKDSLDQGHLPNDVLTLDCEIEKSSGKTYTNIEKSSYGDFPQQAITDENNELINDFKKLFNHMKNSDVELRVGGKTTVAHKLLLFARSPVLREILKDKSPDAEGGQIVVDIDDVDIHTLTRMLRFIYTEETGTLDFGSCLKLFAAGDIYKVISLKEKCSAQLNRLISVPTVCEVLVAAHRYSDPELEESTIDFLAEYWDEISLSEEWEEFLKQNKELAAETRKRIRAKRLKE